MGIAYRLDWRELLDIIYPGLMPGIDYDGPYTDKDQTEYDTLTTWYAGLDKPTWETLVDMWTTFNATGSGLMLDTPPGAVGIFPQTADFGDWLYVDPIEGRVLDRETYAALFKAVGTTHNGLYSEIQATEFGLTKDTTSLGNLFVYRGKFKYANVYS